MLDPILQAFDTVRQTAVSAGTSLMRVPPVVRIIADRDEWATIIYASLSPPEVDAIIEREIDFFKARGIEFEWKVYEHDEPANLKDRLKERGFEIGEEEAFLVLDLESQPADSIALGTTEVRRADTLEGLSDARTVWESVFEKDFAFTYNELKNELESGSRGQVAFVAYDQGQPVSAGRCTFDEGPFVGLYTGGTLASHRGRGFYRAVVAARAKEAINRGKSYLTTDARPTSLPILLRHGFKRLSTTWPCVWKL